jgi:hypothetical protein
MNPASISAIANAIPGSVEVTEIPDDWCGNLLPVGEDDDLFGEVEDDLFGDYTESPSTDIEEPWRDTSLGPPGSDEIDRSLPDGQVTDSGIYNEAIKVAEGLREALGQDFPGAPGAGQKGMTPPPDVLAFYLPWHDFSRQRWGIYLIAEGVRALGLDIYRRANIYKRASELLSKAEANRVASIFMFHHEAYHNIVETFAARLEVSHRTPCYRRGFRHIWQTGFGAGLHEEGLATAYAYEKVRTEAFADVLPPGSCRTSKRRLAAGVLRDIIATMPPPYFSALKLIGPRPAIRLETAQHEFQEANHAASGFGLPGVPPSLWEASGHAMHPSLGRNRRFSYLIDRSHPLLRLAATVPHFARREVIRRLQLAVGAVPTAGGEHPHVTTRSGKKVPVPGDREIKRGTARAILRQAGLTIPISRFMQATDQELAVLGSGRG